MGFSLFYIEIKMEIYPVVRPAGFVVRRGVPELALRRRERRRIGAPRRGEDEAEHFLRWRSGG